MKGWIGVDLDGTLAHYERWQGIIEHIGDPIGPMIERVRKWISEGHTVKIFTARVSNKPQQREVIQDWLESQGLPRLEVTATKDFDMIELWDDRCVQVIPNEGKSIVEEIMRVIREG